MTDVAPGRRRFGFLRSPPVLLLAVLLVGILIGRSSIRPSGPSEPGHDHTAEAEEAATTWTCSMHPQIKLPEPGQCPICFMDLIPVEMGTADDTDAPRLEMSEAARALAEIETTPVVRDRPFVEIRLVGKVDYDETRIGAITAWVPGRLDRLYVDYTGITVRKGDDLAEIYSPDLLSAEEELVQALRAVTNGAGTSLFREASEATVQAARDKLRLLGVTASQIEEIESGRKPSDHLTLYAQSGGVVIEKNAVEGDYVQTGTPIYRIADLSRLWVLLDAYEADLAWLRYGQEVEFTTEALPGEQVAGKISFISPTLDPTSRTVKVRVNVENPRGLLKPEMFVRARVLAETDAAGSVIAEDLAGKWICPMHPEVVKGQAADCDVCGMDLVRAEELGYVAAAAEGAGPLLVPRSAVLFTGKRAIVYVQVPDTDRPTYEGREIVLGPRAGEVYVVKSGLAEGERVVVNGSFKIDSALQIQAKPSMMSARDGGGAPAPAGKAAGLASPAFLATLTPVYEKYFELSAALSGDDLDATRESFSALHPLVHSIGEEGLSARGRQEWRRLSKELMTALQSPGKDAAMDALRASFADVSAAVIELEKAFGHASEGSFYLTYCPMAFEFQGAHWMQDHDRIDNPYFGAKMLRCGEVQEEFAAAEGGR
jgi:Cu(I)/Ag(I) efflux system membrane fusion protein